MRSPRLGAGLLALALLAGGVVGAGPARAAPTSATEETPTVFSQKAAPSRDVATTYPMPRTLPTGGSGPLVVDHAGNVWFRETFEEPVGGGAEAGHPNKVVRMNRAGEITVVTEGAAGELAVAPDGAVWFTGFREVERIAPDGLVESFPLEERETPTGELVRLTLQDPIVIGDEGDAWVDATRQTRDEAGGKAASESVVVRIAPSGQMTEFALPAGPGGEGYVARLAVGPEGNIWFAAATAYRVGYVTPAGRVEAFPTLAYGSTPAFITAGPDGAMWFLIEEKGPVLARVSTTGALSGVRLGGEKEYLGGRIVAGPDGRLWFGAEGGVIGRLDPETGRLSKVTLPNDGGPDYLAVGPEGEVWYSSSAGPPCLSGDTACGGAGYYRSGIIGRVTPEPLSLELAGAKAAHGGRQVKVRVQCLDGNASSVCRGKLRLRVGGAKAARSFSLGTDLGRLFTLALPQAARAKLLRRHRLAVRVEATLAGGRRASQRFSLRSSPAAHGS